MRMPRFKSKGEQLDLLDAKAVALTDCTPIEELGIGALEVDEQPLSTSHDTSALDVFAGRALVCALLWTVWDKRRTDSPGTQSFRETAWALLRPCETRPLVADRD